MRTVLITIAALAILLGPYVGLAIVWLKYRALSARHAALKATYERRNAELTALRAPEHHRLMVDVHARPALTTLPESSASVPG